MIQSKVCRYFQTARGCRLGEDCTYAHGDATPDIYNVDYRSAHCNFNRAQCPHGMMEIVILLKL
ncbi:hypothetical protein TSUD_382890 [Trifolium subterraneum]|uniref:C3H1-type domain-containing protein n=1 Tax=Trifolium subterraneum TaxID=3900 RepID=A0A2Z6NLE0_TRISU|nr:hypothetical protein TSUD_382890 [Trifolium subterraneum]